MGDPKQVIVLRKDLNMRKGKMVAQGAHASMKVILDLGSHEEQETDLDVWEKVILIRLKSDALCQWLSGSFKKITVSVDSEAELLEVYEKAKGAGVLCSLIQDSGLTEFGGVKTYTAVAIGPDYPEKIDPLTGHLKLL